MSFTLKTDSLNYIYTNLDSSLYSEYLTFLIAVLIYNYEIILRKNFYELRNFNEQKLIQLIENINTNYSYNKLLIKNLKKKIFGENVPLKKVYDKIIKLSNEANYI